jgi:spermidine/putrescine transport system substrate-binding protein
MFLRSLLHLVIVAFALSLLCSSLASADQNRQLVILNWGEYLDPDLAKSFEAEFDVELVQVFYESDEGRTEKLIETDGRGYDLIVSSAVDVGKYLKRGWLAPLDEKLLPRLKDINPRWRQGFIGAEDYALPFAWGTTGIIYRTDLVNTPITSWRQFFVPDEELRGKIAMTGDSQDFISMALKSLGYPANSEDREQLKEVENLLLAQKPFIRSYKYISVQEDSAIVKGDIVASMVYNTDAMMVKEHNDHLTYVLPEEGGALWIDCFTVAAYSRNPDLAYAFLNFFNKPENSAQQARYAYTPATNLEAEKLLPKDFLEDSVIYPNRGSLEKSELSKPISARSQRRRNAIAARIIR